MPEAPTPSTLLSAHEVRVLRGEQVTLGGVSLQLQRHERVALLGRNGAGKTTLLDVLSGKLTPDEGLVEGTVWLAPDTRVGTLAQHADFAPKLSVRKLVERANPYTQALARLRVLEGQLETHLHEYSRLGQWLDAAQAYRWPARAAKMLGVLDLSRLQEREARTLSGGESTRLRLALALLAEGEVLLLDEPTNHLDIRMREWLETYLTQSGAACIITSHDREFLDKVATRSLWLEGGQVTSYPGGYSRAVQLREAERKKWHKAATLSQREKQRLAGSLERLDVWGKQARGLKSRAQRLQVTEMPLPERRLTMRLLAGHSRAQVLVWARGLGRSYGTRQVLSGVSFKVRQGDRIVLMGGNGTGKSTLLEVLAGRLYPDTAQPDAPAPLTFAAGVTVAYLDQTWHGLTPQVNLLTQFEQRFGAQARSLLAQAGFTVSDWPKTPHELSGGERSRAGLALVSALRADLLLLDEPTNHLDIQALEALEAAVQAYSGVVIIVTHDRRFAREVATRVWQLERGHLQELEGWGSRVQLDPNRNLSSDPPPAPPEGKKAALRRLEDQLLTLETQLFASPTQREASRLQSERLRVRAALYEQYAEYYAAPSHDAEVKQGGLRVCAQRLESGGMFWAGNNETASNESCPHLAWDGATLRWNTLPTPQQAWYGQQLLLGTLRILFERWQVTRVILGEGGPTLKRRGYFERELGLRRR